MAIQLSYECSNITLQKANKCAIICLHKRIYPCRNRDIKPIRKLGLDSINLFENWGWTV